MRKAIRPDEPDPKKRPTGFFTPVDAGSGFRPPHRDQDAELHEVLDWWRSQPNASERFGQVLRDSLDRVLDGERTGRWDYLHLSKTEKAHLGSQIEVSLVHEFALADGARLDCSINGIEIDCKNAQTLYGWMIPPQMWEKQQEIALLVWMNDYESRWAAGLLRCHRAALKDTENQDKKRALNNRGRDEILWIWEPPIQRLPINVLLHLSVTERTRMFRASGQAAVAELFRLVQGQLVDRATVLTVAFQQDSMKRVRDARIRLRAEGIVILGHERAHQEIASRLGLPVPTKGKFVSATVSRCPKRCSGCVGIGRSRWRQARPGDKIVTAPLLPRSIKGVRD